MISALLVPLILAYTVALGLLARRAHRRGSAADFMNAGGQLSARKVFVLISALWCSSIFVVEMETGYLYGFSAVWFGVGTVLLAVASGYLLPSLRRLGYLTSSGIIGERFGSRARVVSGLVIGVTFPIFAMSNVLAAAAFFHVVVGWSLPITLAVTAAIVAGYVALGGMGGLAATQTANFVVMGIGLVLVVVLVFHAVPMAKIHAQVPPRMLRPAGVGLGLIITWIAAALLNVVNAQAEFQILTAAKDDRAGRRGLNASVVVISLFTMGAVAVGVAARAVSLPHTLGVVAVPALLVRTAPPVLVAIVALAVWASALSWSAPLMFSGASSLGIDVLATIRSLTTAPARRWCVAACLPLQAILVMGFGVLRPADLAWWRVFGQTVRTGALLGPTLAVLALPLVRRRSAVVSMLVGAGAGIGWNVLTGFSTTHFAPGVNPMWVGAAAGLLVVAVDLLVQTNPRVGLLQLGRQPVGWTTGIGAVGLIVLLVAIPGPLNRAGLTGPMVLSTAGALLLATKLIHKAAGAPVTPPVRQPAVAAHS